MLVYHVQHMPEWAKPWMAGLLLGWLVLVGGTLTALALWLRRNWPRA